MPEPGANTSGTLRSISGERGREAADGLASGCSNLTILVMRDDGSSATLALCAWAKVLVSAAGGSNRPILVRSCGISGSTVAIVLTADEPAITSSGSLG